MRSGTPATLGVAHVAGARRPAGDRAGKSSASSRVLEAVGVAGCGFAGVQIGAEIVTRDAGLSFNQQHVIVRDPAGFQPTANDGLTLADQATERALRTSCTHRLRKDRI